MNYPRFGNIVAFNIQIKHHKPVVFVTDMRHRFNRSRLIFRCRALLSALMIFLILTYYSLYEIHEKLMTLSLSIRDAAVQTDDLLPYDERTSITPLTFALEKKTRDITVCDVVPEADVWLSDPGVKYIFGAVATISYSTVNEQGTASETSWDRFLVIGQYHYEEMGLQYLCCYTNSQLGVASFARPLQDTYQRFHSNNHLIFRTITCPNNRPPNVTESTMLTVVRDGDACPSDNSRYLRPYFRSLQEGSGKVAVCSKVAYGSLNVEMLIEWMEVHRILGVSKVLLYIDVSTDNRTRELLRYYEKTGFLETKPYTQPNTADGRFYSDLGTVSPQTTSNKLVPLTHCVLSLSGYTYVGILDLDEFVIPSAHRSIPQLMNDLWTLRPTAAGFSLSTVYHMLSWESYPDPDGLVLSLYRTQTRSMSLMDRQKNFFMPSRIKLDGTMTTHDYTALSGFTREKCPDDETVIRHFRKCRKTRMKRADSWLCYNPSLRTIDQEYVEQIETFRPLILAARQNASYEC